MRCVVLWKRTKPWPQVRGARGGGSKIVLTSSSKVENSPKKFSGVEAIIPKEPAVVSVNDVCSLCGNEEMIVTIKVKSVDPTKQVKNQDGKRLKKHSIVGDCDGC